MWRLKGVGVTAGKGFRRAVEALCLEEPDTVPVFEMHVPPSMTRRILGRTPLLSNTSLCLDLISKGKAERVNRGVVRDLVELHRRLGLDFMRVPGGYSKRSRVVKVSENTWAINGSKHIWYKGTLWRADRPTAYDPNEILKELKAQGALAQQNLDETLSVLSGALRKAKEETFVTFDADGSWGPLFRTLPC